MKLVEILKNKEALFIIDDVEDKKTKALVKEKETTQKHLLFSGMHVNVKKYKLSETETGQYQEAYQNIFDDIREHGV